MGVYDYIVVGQGLAGTALAYSLYKAGAKVCIVQDSEGESSSSVAAGLYNPVTGRKMVKTWKADILFPELRRFYREAEQACGADFLNELPIYRPFVSIEEQNEWMGKSALDEYKDYIRDIRTGSGTTWTNDPYGGVLLNNSGFLDIPKYLSAMKDFFHAEMTYIESRVDYDTIEADSSGVSWKGLKASGLIFCEGTHVVNNPFFSWLPFRPVKGEVIDIQMKVETSEIINRHVFVLPLPGGTFRVGSTYDNNDRSWQPTAEGRAKIEEQLGKLISAPYRVIGHRAGVRPATADRRPILGRHPEHETIFLFNGLGTKGVSLSPAFAAQLTNLLMKQNEPDKEVNISRYFSLY